MDYHKRKSQEKYKAQAGTATSTKGGGTETDASAEGGSAKIMLRETMVLSKIQLPKNGPHEVLNSEIVVTYVSDCTT